MPSGSLLAAAIAADNLITAVYAGVMMVLPERWPGQVAAVKEGVDDEEEEEEEEEEGRVLESNVAEVAGGFLYHSL